MSSKTVVAIVRRYEYGIEHTFVESAEVGLDNHYATASEFLQSLQKLYVKNSTQYGVNSFEIVNVVIG